MDTNDFSNKRTEDVIKDITDKIKKLTAALYRVTDLMSDKEPIKWLLRNKAVGLYDNLASFDIVKDKNFVLNETMDSFRQMAGSLELCVRGSAMSNLNFEILKREYLNLKSYIEGNKNNLVSEELFLIEEKASLTALGGGGEKTDNKRAVIAPVNNLNDNGGKQPDKAKKTLSEIKDSAEGRKQKIVEFLKKEGAKTISEIGAIFDKTISLKTIQRDLAALLTAGQLSAKGEKRWRSYFV